MDLQNRVVVLIDMDCFYCQVEEKLNPELKGKPIAVVQYNPWKGGGIIAVNYMARAMGVSRHLRGDDAKEMCPDIQLPCVPCNRGKADTTKYRDAGKEVAKVLQKFTPALERASVDEAYLDITAPVEEKLKTLNSSTITKAMLPNTFALGYDSVDSFIEEVNGYSSDSIDFDHDHVRRLLVGAVIVSEIRAAVYEETGYECSAGIAHNKILAKLVCGMNKPNKQTILPKHSINILYKSLPIKKVKHLGGKFGCTVCDILKINNMDELQKFTEKELQTKFDEKNGTWLYNIARGVDLEPVQAKFHPKSIGCCKQFRGKAALLDLESLGKWLKDLGDEIEERLEKDALENNRTPKQMVVSFSTQLYDRRDTSSSRSYNFVHGDELCAEFFSSKALELILDSIEGVKPKDGESNRRLKAPIKFLGISVGKFEDNVDNKKTKNIMDYFGASSSKDSTTKSTLKEIDKEIFPIERKIDEINEDSKGGTGYVFKKIVQVTENDNKKENIPEVESNTVNTNSIYESTLDKQESFFAKFFINKSENPQVASETHKSHISKMETDDIPITNCEDSSDTNYSGSTIDNEINKSIALFEDDAEDVARISKIRELMNNSKIIYDEESTETVPENTETRMSSPYIDTFDCTECNKTLPVTMLEIHGDYHFALRLREEDKEQMRNDMKGNTTQKVVEKHKKGKKSVEEYNKKNKTVTSITNFVVKINDTIPTETCAQCAKKVPVEKFTEHLDFHEAQKLNRELNKKPTTCFFNSSLAKKRKSDVLPTKKMKVPCKSIDSFFK